MPSERPTLAGRRVVVTRAAHQSTAQVGALEALGAQVIHLPCLAIARPEDLSPLDRALTAEAAYDALLFPSVNAAQVALDRAEEVGAALPAAMGAVGAKTAAYLAERLPLAHLIAPERSFRGEGLVEALVHELGPLSGRRFLLLRSPEGRDALGDGLRDQGATVDEVMAYRIIDGPPASPSVLDGADAFLFMSGRTLEAFLRVIGEAEARARLAAATVAVIGPVAAQAAEALGVRVDVVPEVATGEALIEALASRLSAG